MIASPLSLFAGVNVCFSSRVMMAPEENIEVSPAPFPHWTIREILDQPEAIERALNFGGRVDMGNRAKLGGLETHVGYSILTPVLGFSSLRFHLVFHLFSHSELLAIENLVIAACGTSLFAGLYGAALMRWLDSFTTVQVFDAAELIHDFIPKVAPGLLVISQSGLSLFAWNRHLVSHSFLVPCCRRDEGRAPCCEACWRAWCPSLLGCERCRFDDC